MIEDLEGDSRQGSASSMQEEGKMTHLEAATVAKSGETGRAFRRRTRRKAGGEGGELEETEATELEGQRFMSRLCADGQKGAVPKKRSCVGLQRETALWPELSCVRYDEKGGHMGRPSRRGQRRKGRRRQGRGT